MANNLYHLKYSILSEFYNFTTLALLFSHLFTTLNNGFFHILLQPFCQPWLTLTLVVLKILDESGLTKKNQYHIENDKQGYFTLVINSDFGRFELG